MSQRARSSTPARKGLVVVASAIAPLVWPAAPPVVAAEPAPAVCTYEVQDTATPGFLLAPSQGTAHGVGTMTCVGTLGGKELAGEPGRFEWWYSYDGRDVPTGANTCATAGGKGTWEVELPISGGAPLPLSGTHAWTGTLVGVFTGELGGLPVRLTYEAYSAHPDENCVTKPAGDLPTRGEGTVG